MLIAMCGKPSAGKSSFFQACTSVAVPRAAYPFTTIKPNRAVGYVEVECVDKDFNVQCNPRSGYCVNHRRFVPVELLDVAGLVPGAHEGKGLGNKFLDDLRQANLLIHVVDASGGTNENGEAVTVGSYDPVKDVEFLEQEINFWIKGILDDNQKKLAREPGKIEEVLTKQFSGLGFNAYFIRKTLLALNLNEKKIADWNDEDKLKFCTKLREVGKPIIIAANKCDVSTASANIERLKKTYPHYLIVPCSAEVEIALKQAAKAGFIDYVPGDANFTIKKELTPAQKQAMELMQQVCAKFNGTGVQKCLNAAVFDYLKYIAVFPGGVNNLEDSNGNVLPDVFLLPPGSTAVDFAYTLHTDMGNGFIRCVDVKTRLSHGKEHPLKNRDVIELFFKK